MEVTCSTYKSKIKFFFKNPKSNKQTNFYLLLCLYSFLTFKHSYTPMSLQLQFEDYLIVTVNPVFLLKKKLDRKNLSKIDCKKIKNTCLVSLICWLTLCSVHFVVKKLNSQTPQQQRNYVHNIVTIRVHLLKNNYSSKVLHCLRLSVDSYIPYFC